MDPEGSQFVCFRVGNRRRASEGGARSGTISVTALERRFCDRGRKRKISPPSVSTARIRACLASFCASTMTVRFLDKILHGNVLEDLAYRAQTADVSKDHLSAEHGGHREIKGKNYVTLLGTTAPTQREDSAYERETSELLPDLSIQASLDGARAAPAGPPAASAPLAPRGVEHRGAALDAAIADDKRRRRVFITHGKNRDLVDPIRKLLEYGELEPVVSVERQSVSKPVPEKVLDDMRSSGAAIIHVDADRTIVDAEGNEHVLLNPNVLIEIGAAMAFYGRRFILLVRDGVKLPSNLQGLYEVRYQGETLDASATIKLLEAIKDIKNYGLPSAVGGET